MISSIKYEIYAVISNRRWEMKLFYEPLFGFEYVCRARSSSAIIFRLVDRWQWPCTHSAVPATTSPRIVSWMHDGILNNRHSLFDFEVSSKKNWNKRVGEKIDFFFRVFKRGQILGGSGQSWSVYYEYLAQCRVNMISNWKSRGTIPHIQTLFNLIYETQLSENLCVSIYW